MKAIRIHKFGPPEVMTLEEIDSLQPGHGEVLVDVRAVGVNPVDTYIRAGIYFPDLPLPYTPGIDAAGTIVAIGEGVHHRRVGDRVYVAWSQTGTYAEQVLCREFQTHTLPAKTSFAQGAALGVPYGAAYRALFQRAHALAGENVLIHGASGGVGLGAVQLARAAGLRVIGTAGSAEGRELVKAQGAHEVLDHHDPGHFDQLWKLTCGRGIDVVLEMLANVNLDRDLSILATGGRVVVIGSRGRIEIDPRQTLRPESAILGMSLYSANEQENMAIHAALVAGLENGTLKPIISREMSLVEAAAAHHAVLDTSTLGKIVLVP